MSNTLGDLRAAFITQMGVDEELLVEFSLVFMRFEYALKRTRFAKRTKNNGIDPDWDAFAKHCDDRDLIANVCSEEFKKALAYLEHEPPQRQKFDKNGKLKFAAETDDDRKAPTAKRLYTRVRRARNNLFHGGKFDKPFFGSERNAQLLRHSLAVLVASLDFDADVKHAFLEKS